ncbi:hypothetical protein EVAR_95600_1 [Eumeta japonica]|uniref:Uncharacterized protein n=1 Tax=Eumeta variegata TaxID=151549 RepID=A0A4C1VKB3_EUMVA|nr:hypothetical protein EVAR_95600_1 [Eumeta japonica]
MFIGNTAVDKSFQSPTVRDRKFHMTLIVVDHQLAIKMLLIVFPANKTMMEIGARGEVEIAIQSPLHSICDRSPCKEMLYLFTKPVDRVGWILLGC